MFLLYILGDIYNLRKLIIYVVFCRTLNANWKSIFLEFIKEHNNKMIMIFFTLNRKNAINFSQNSEIVKYF